MRTYVIARMYAGSYIDSKLGGEAINLLHDDHGNNYVFVGPYGFIDKKYDDTVEAVILTRLTKAGCFEILGIAKTGKASQVTYQKGYKLEERFDNARVHLTKFAKEHDIKYGGVYLQDINKGTFFGAEITFKSDVLLLPKEELFITDSHTKDYKIDSSLVVNLPDKRFPKQSLHAYITSSEHPVSFARISSLITQDELWEKDRINKIDEGKVIDKHYNFLDIIRKEFDELAYSNLFKYIFTKYPLVFVEFAREVLGVDISKPFIVEREKKNIDLWVEDSQNIIVIENKIKAGISGVPERYNFAEGGLVQSQLLKYYNYAEEVKGSKQTTYFLFVPNYNKIDLRKYSGSKNYKVIKYSEIYTFYKKRQIADFYYKEFVNALYRHTKDRQIDYAEDMSMRFLDIIKKFK